ncbi:MAG TPA: YdcF family protein [Stellaceae bacterium]|nr:YdcF family protein [Stellaceae bacterium]
MSSRAAPMVKRPRRWRRWLGVPAALLTFLFLLWLAGLAWFARSIPDEVRDPTTDTDAIVVLTGGSLRVQSGIALLNAGKAKKLFVSGVHHGTDVLALLRAEHQPPDKVPCCIALGYDADNTLGNAQETAAWMREEGFHSLRLVTASYHMPRSLLEFSRAMPEVRIIPHPVFPERVKQERWWAWPGTASLIVAEYEKYLLAWARPMLGLGAGGSEAS